MRSEDIRKDNKMNIKIQKIIEEIEKTKHKAAEMQIRLRDLDRQKTELENADIVALVRGIDVSPDEFADFIRAFKDKRAVPDVITKHIKKEEEA